MKKWILLLGVALMLCYTVETLYAPPRPGRPGGPGRNPGMPWNNNNNNPGPKNNNPADNTKLDYVEGVLKTVKSDAKNQSVTITRKQQGKDEIDVTLAVNGQTQILVGDDATQLADLVVGSKVIAGFAKPSGGAAPLAVIIRVLKDDKGGETKPGKDEGTEQPTE